MSRIGVALAAALVAVAGGGAAAYPLDIENDAVWLVRDSLPEQRGGAPPWQVEIRDLRSRDLARGGGGGTVAVICGTLDFADADEGASSFIVFYAGDGRGAVAPIGPPLFYRASPGGEIGGTQDQIARATCDATASGEDGTVTAAAAVVAQRR
jgi:hypothetical protein